MYCIRGMSWYLMCTFSFLAQLFLTQVSCLQLRSKTCLAADLNTQTKAQKNELNLKAKVQKMIQWILKGHHKDQSNQWQQNLQYFWGRTMTPVAMMREYERAESQVSSNTKSCLGYLKIPWNLSHLNLEFLQDYGIALQIDASQEILHDNLGIQSLPPAVLGSQCQRANDALKRIGNRPMECRDHIQKTSASKQKWRSHGDIFRWVNGIIESPLESKIESGKNGAPKIRSESKCLEISA